MRAWVRAVLDTLFPEPCRLCASPAVDAALWICPRCLNASPPSPPPFCARCGREVPPGGPDHVGPLVHAATRYAPGDRVGAAIAVRLLKFHGRRRLAPALAALLYHRAPVEPDTLIVPVPLSTRRLRARGFNQAALIAWHFARAARARVRPGALMKVRDTPAQSGLARVERLPNLAGAFRAVPRLVRGVSVTLVDDVLTTGATLDACARALREAGAASIAGRVVARRLWLSMPGATR